MLLLEKNMVTKSIVLLAALTSLPGIACAQQDVSRVYALTDDPHACVVDFLERSATHAHEFAERLAHQEASVERFIELSDAA